MKGRVRGLFSGPSPENELPEHVDRVLSKPPKLADLRSALAELVRSS